MSRGKLVVSSLCLILLCVAFAAAPAQALGPRALRLMLGGSWMDQSYDYKNLDLLDPERKFWVTGGVSLEIGVFGNSPLDLEVGAMYFQKGMQIEVKEYDEVGTYIGKVTLDPYARYLSIPVLLRFTLARGPISPYVVAGPTLEIMLSKEPGAAFEEVFDRMDTANLGVQVGVGAELGNIGASVRYIRDLNTPYNKIQGTTLESVVNDGILALVTVKILGR